MELRHLRYFVAVAEARSFTGAADLLHTSQPSLSRQVRDLENHIGTPLLDRFGHRLVLTAAGQAFLDEARLTLAQADRAVERARRAARARSESLTVGFDYGLEAGYLARLTAAMHGSGKVTDLLIRSLPSPTMIQDVKEGRLDAAFVLLDADVPPLQSLRLRRDALVLVLPKKHRLARQGHAAVADLAGERLIMANARHAPVLHTASLVYGVRNGTALQPAYEADGMMMALSLVSSLGGVCLLPEYSTLVLPGDVSFVRLEGHVPEIDLGLIWHPDNASMPLKTLLGSFQALSSDA